MLQTQKMPELVEVMRMGKDPSSYQLKHRQLPLQVDENLTVREEFRWFITIFVLKTCTRRHMSLLKPIMVPVCRCALAYICIHVTVIFDYATIVR